MSDCTRSYMQVQYREEYKSFTHFITSVCAIIGGVFTVSGLIDSFIYHGQKVGFTQQACDVCHLTMGTCSCGVEQLRSAMYHVLLQAYLLLHLLVTVRAKRSRPEWHVDVMRRPSRRRSILANRYRSPLQAPV